MNTPHFGRPAGALAMSLVAIIALGALQAGAEVSKKTTKPGAIDLTIAELSHFQLFTPTLPNELPAQIEFSLPINGVATTVVLDKASIRGDHFKVLVDTGNGVLTEVAPPAIRTYKGTLAGRPGTSVAGSLLPTGFSGTIQLEDETTWAVQPLSDFRPELARNGQHVSYSAADAIPDGRGCALGQPGFPLEKYRSPLSQAIAAGTAGNEGGIAGTTPSNVEIACETDNEFYVKNGSNVASTVNDIELIVNNVNVIYDRDVNIIFQLGTLVIRADINDPYVTTTIDGRLTEFGTKWASTPESGIFRDISHMFSGYNFAGGTIGLAYLGVVCNTINGAQYGVVESRYTTSLTFRISLSAHELGHNWNAGHCDAQGTAACHIMCSSNGGCGGISGTNLKFDPQTISEVTTYLGQVSCDFVRPLPVTPPFTETFAATTLSTARWTYNDGGVVNINATNEPSALYSLNLNSTGAALYDDDEVRTNFILLGGTSTATAEYKVERIGVEAGETLIVEYLNNLLDWTPLNTLTSDGTNQTVFTNYSHSLPTAARHNQFRLRFRTDGNDTGDNWYIDDVSVFVVVAPPPPANDECLGAITIGLGTTGFNSTDATNTEIPIAASCTANSDGVVAKDVWFKYVASCTGLTTISTCGLAAFDTRIVAYVASTICPSLSSAVAGCNDNGTGCVNGNSSATFNAVFGNSYFIRVGGASAGGSGSILLSCAVNCPADVNNDQFVDAADLTDVLANWGGAGTGDINQSGIVDGFDLTILLAGWGLCP